MASDRLVRALRLSSLLKSGHVATARELASRFQCSRRTIFRDLKLLNDSGFTATFDTERGGYVAGESPAPEGSMTNGEITALFLGAAFSPLSEVKVFRENLARALRMIFEACDDPTQSRITNLVESLVFENPCHGVSVQGRRVLENIVEGIAARKRIDIRLFSSDPISPGTTKLAPYRLIVNGKVTVLGNSSSHRRVLSVDLNEITFAKPTDEGFTVPAAYRGNGHWWRIDDKHRKR